MDITALGLDWTAKANLAGLQLLGSECGEEREPGRDSLGWATPVELHRPLPSYDELGGVLGGRPHELYDKMFILLGLERITEAGTRLSAALRQLQAPQLAVKVLTQRAQTAERLRHALGAVAGHAGNAADVGSKYADLLSQALAMHRDHGDQPSPVCGVGTLDT